MTSLAGGPLPPGPDRPLDATGRHPWNRLVAWLVDWLCILVWVAVTAAVGVPLFLAGVTDGLSTGALNVVATVVIVVPVTLALARLESGPRQATLGKRVRRVRVVDTDTGGRVSFRRALLRNTLKITVPWTFAHAVVYALVGTGTSGDVPLWLWVATVAAYVLPAVYVASLFLRGGRTPYDLASRTSVITWALRPQPPE